MGSWIIIAIVFLVGIIVGVVPCFLICKGNHKKVISLSGCVSFISRFWYPIILILSSIYVYIHYDTCVRFEFFSNFQGENLIFLVWILLCLLPLFEKFEIFSAKFKLQYQNKESAKAAGDIIHSKTLSVDELAEMMSKKEDK